jgi:hypothetical protein
VAIQVSPQKIILNSGISCPDSQAAGWHFSNFWEKYLTRGMAQAVKNLLCKHKALSSNPSLTNKERKRWRERRGEKERERRRESKRDRKKRKEKRNYKTRKVLKSPFPG